MMLVAYKATRGVSPLFEWYPGSSDGEELRPIYESYRKMGIPGVSLVVIPLTKVDAAVSTGQIPREDIVWQFGGV